MPTHIALKLCPNLVILPVNMHKYKSISEKFLQIIEEYDPDYESMGLDEAKLDLTGYLNETHELVTKETIEELMAEI